MTSRPSGHLGRSVRAVTCTSLSSHITARIAGNASTLWTTTVTSWDIAWDEQISGYLFEDSFVLSFISELFNRFNVGY